MGWLRLLRRGVFEHRGRAVVSIISVALGVAMYLGVARATRALSASSTRRTTAGPTNAPVLNLAGGVRPRAPFKPSSGSGRCPTSVQREGVPPPHDGHRPATEPVRRSTSTASRDDVLRRYGVRSAVAGPAADGTSRHRRHVAERTGVDVGQSLSIRVPTEPTAVVGR